MGLLLMVGILPLLSVLPRLLRSLAWTAHYKIMVVMEMDNKDSVPLYVL